jgi:ribose transport system permease protein
MSTNSIKSDALEPTRGELKNASGAERLRRRLPVYGLPILTVLLIILFSLLLPQTFPTMLTSPSVMVSCSGTSWPSACKRCSACHGRSRFWW